MCRTDMDCAEVCREGARLCEVRYSQTAFCLHRSRQGATGVLEVSRSADGLRKFLYPGHAGACRDRTARPPTFATHPPPSRAHTACARAPHPRGRPRGRSLRRWRARRRRCLSRRRREPRRTRGGDGDALRGSRATSGQTTGRRAVKCGQPRTAATRGGPRSNHGPGRRWQLAGRKRGRVAARLEPVVRGGVLQIQPAHLVRDKTCPVSTG